MCALSLCLLNVYFSDSHCSQFSSQKCPCPDIQTAFKVLFLTTGKFDSNIFLKMKQMLAHNVHIKYLNEIGPSVSKSYIRSNELVFPLGRKENMLMVWLILTRLGYNNILLGQSSSCFKALNFIARFIWCTQSKVTYFHLHMQRFHLSIGNPSIDH